MRSEIRIPVQVQIFLLRSDKIMLLLKHETIVERETLEGRLWQTVKWYTKNTEESSVPMINVEGQANNTEVWRKHIQNVMILPCAVVQLQNNEIRRQGNNSYSLGMTEHDHGDEI